MDSARTVLITGAGTGLGLETALTLASRGFRVYGSVLDRGQAAAIESSAHARGVHIDVVELDITRSASIEAALQQVLAETGRIDVLVNNAGVRLRGCIEDLTDREIERLFETNVFGTTAVTRAVLPHMRTARRGHIILVTSVGGRIGSFGVGAYCATKFAQEGFGESLAQEVAPFGIRVSLVEPAIVRTEAWTINRVSAAASGTPASPYAEWFRRAEALADDMVRTSPTTAADVASAIHRVITSARPPLRTLVGRRARLVVGMRRYVPGEVFDRVYFGQILKRVTGRVPPPPAAMPLDDENRTVLVTGASGGVGRATVERLAACGWRVYAGVRDPGRWRPPSGSAAPPDRIRVIPLDITDAQSVASAVETVVAQAGRLDALVNNAGVYLRGFFEDLDEEEVRRVFAVNVFGTMRMTRAVMPVMRAAGRGRIVTVSSVAGRSGALSASVYCASKFALEGFGESLAMEAAPWGLAASLVEPAILRTGVWASERGAGVRALDPASPYADLYLRARELMDRAARTSPTSEADVAAGIERALRARRPRLRYLIGRRARALFALRRYAPGEFVDRLYAGRVVRYVTDGRRSA